MENWINGTESENDIVISSRIRLARNIEDVPFPNRLKEQEGKELVEKVKGAFNEDNNTFSSINLWDNNDLSNRVYLEKHMISEKLLINKSIAAFMINNNETVSLMINEEDHIRLQCITSGLNIEKAYEVANKIDDGLEAKLNYAFDEKLGYLTSCPTNLGTGLRASVMIHLPALSVNNEMSRVLNALTQVGMTIRGLYGEGSKALGNIYQISNQVTLGLTEEDIVENLKAVVHQIINQEELSRERLFNKYNYELEDKIKRSYGILKYAVTLDSDECLKFLSNVRLGVEMGIIKDIDKKTLNYLLLNSRTSLIQQKYGEELKPKDANIKRAQIVRENLK